MALRYYHAEPVANALKSMLSLEAKGLAFERIDVGLHKFAQRSDRFVALNPEGHVRVLDHDGLCRTPGIAGDDLRLAGTNFYQHCGMMVESRFPDLALAARAPRPVEWRERITARDGGAAALAMPGHTNPARRTVTGRAH